MGGRKGVLTRFHVKGVTNDTRAALGATCNDCNGDQLCREHAKEAALRQIAIRLLTCPTSPYFESGIGRQYQREGDRLEQQQVVDQFVERLKEGLPDVAWRDDYVSWVVDHESVPDCPVRLPVRIRTGLSDVPQQSIAIYRALGNGSRRRTKTDF